MEFLVEIEIGPIPADVRDEVLVAERERGAELVAAGTIERIWRIPGRHANVGIWVAEDASALHRAICSLPAHPWMDVAVSALAVHPLEGGGARD
jgi:muconolactone D-isomerase